MVRQYPMRKEDPCITQVESGRYRFMGRVWIEGSDGAFLGYGRITLLQRIRDYGSIREAAKSMSMSYRHAWELVDSMNKQARLPLVQTATGGKGGGGAILTEEGRKAIEAYLHFRQRFEDFLRAEKELFSL